MAGNTNSDKTTGALMKPEIGPDGIIQESPAIAYTEKIIEAEQLQLRKYIDDNYSKIRDVERELANLSMEMKLTSGPKKAALELMRKKIEVSTEKIRTAKSKEEQAKKAWEDAAKAVKDEEVIKQKLCEDLNNLVTESSNSQLARLEELKRRMEALNPSRSSSLTPPSDGNHRPAEVSISGVPSTSEPGNRTAGDVTNAGNPLDKGQDPKSTTEGKKKGNIHGKVRGIGAVPKGRASGWTGAGFDVDARG